MEKKRYRIYFQEGFDEDIAEATANRFSGADYQYHNNYARFCGTGEEFEEFKRLLRCGGVLGLREKCETES